MMKKMKKLALVLVCVLVVGLLGGCAMSFDASGYVKALLDNSYKNDSTGFVAMKIGSAEEATTLYEQGLDAEMTTFATTSGVVLTEDQEALYREMFADMLANARYTVGEAVKQDDGSYVVTVTYEKMNIYGPTNEAYMEIITPLLEEWMTNALSGQEVPSEEEMQDIIMVEMVNCLRNTLETVTYDEPATITVRVDLVNRVYTANQEDFLNLEMALFDVEAGQAVE